MKRSELKSLVKDCLVEVLAEALVPAMERAAKLREREAKLDESLTKRGSVAAAPSQQKRAAANGSSSSPHAAAILREQERLAARRRVAESFSVGQDAFVTNEQGLESAVFVPQESSGDMLTDIFADTMRTTLAVAEAADHATPAALVGDAAQRAAARAQPTDIGDPAVWQRLAFAGMPSDN